MSPVVPVVQHIPAWKRLGLKLKYAKDERLTEPNVQVVSKTDGTKKRKVSDEEAIEANSTSTPPEKAKKSRKIHNASIETSLSDRNHQNDKPAVVPETQLEPVASESPSNTKPTRLESTKRKSVSFAPEAKTQDGDSAKDLYNQWLVTQKADDTTFDPTTAATALKVVAPTSKVASTDTRESVSEAPDGQRTKKKKSKKKSKSTTIQSGQKVTSSTKPQQSSAKDSEPRPHPALSYLTEFHTSPTTWKFCKNHQTYLLKNLFSLDKIPCSYNPALKAYLTGLKGLSARQSIRKTALEMREKDEMFLSDILAKGRREGWEAKRRREQYDAAWKREKDRLKEIEDLREWEEGREEFEWRLKKRRRAEEVLWAVGEVESKQSPDAPMSTERKRIVSAASTTNHAAPGKINIRANTTPDKKQPEPKKKRKRKRRTTGVPDDDMFNSSSSSSDADSDAELVNKTKITEDKNVPQRPDEAGKKLNDSSPSSGLGGSSTDSKEGGTSSSGSEESESDSDDEDDGSSSDEDGSGEDGSDGSDD